MGDLTGQTVASTYSQLLNVASLDATYRNVTDGDGTASGLTLSTGGVRASLLNATGAVTFDSTLEVASAITATGGVAGNVTGDVTGDVTGNVTGNVTGSVTGSVTGNVTGDLTGNVTGNVTGSADTLTTGRTISATGDIAWTSAAFDGSGNVTGAATLSDDAVTTAKIADNQVTGAKIAMGSDAQGDILYYDGTDYVRLGAGTSGQVLQSGGASGNPSWVDAPVTPSVTEFTTVGSSNFDATNANLIHVLVIGGGGGSTAATNGGHGGIISDWIDVSSVTGNISVTVGAGGSAGHSSGQGEHNYAAGGTGGASSFGSYLTANGGTGGSRAGTSSSTPHNPGDQGSVSTSRGAALDHTHLTNNYSPMDTSATDPDVYALAAGFDSYGAGGLVLSNCGSNCHNTAGVAGSSGAVIVRAIG